MNCPTHYPSTLLGMNLSPLCQLWRTVSIFCVKIQMSFNYIAYHPSWVQCRLVRLIFSTVSRRSSRNCILSFIPMIALALLGHSPISSQSLIPLNYPLLLIAVPPRVSLHFVLTLSHSCLPPPQSKVWDRTLKWRDMVAYVGE